jgi:hypothetical protein
MQCGINVTPQPPPKRIDRRTKYDLTDKVTIQSHMRLPWLENLLCGLGRGVRLARVQDREDFFTGSTPIPANLDITRITPAKRTIIVRVFPHSVQFSGACQSLKQVNRQSRRSIFETMAHFMSEHLFDPWFFVLCEAIGHLQLPGDYEGRASPCTISCRG